MARMGRYCCKRSLGNEAVRHNSELDRLPHELVKV